MTDTRLNTIICGDCLDIMKEIPSNSIDLVVTSPPYNLKNSTGNGMKSCTKSGKWAGAALQNGYTHHDDCMPHSKYVEWQRNCLSEMFRLIKEDGAIFYKCICSWENGEFSKYKFENIKIMMLIRKLREKGRTRYRTS